MRWKWSDRRLCANASPRFQRPWQSVTPPGAQPRLVSASQTRSSIRERQRRVNERRQVALCTLATADHDGNPRQASQQRSRRPAERERQGEDESGFDNGRHVRSEQGELQPESKDAMHEINAVGIVAQAVPYATARPGEARHKREGSPTTRKAGKNISRRIGGLKGQ